MQQLQHLFCLRAPRTRARSSALSPRAPLWCTYNIHFVSSDFLPSDTRPHLRHTLVVVGRHGLSLAAPGYTVIGLNAFFGAEWGSMRRLLLGAPLLALAAALSPPSVATASSWRLTTAITTVDALERTAGERPHGLLDGMYDPETGLCSEGVWHNAWLGVSRVLISRELRAAAEAMEEAEEVATVRLADRQLAAARTLGASLHTLSFDGRGFRRRTPSGFWEAAADASAAISAAGEDPLFYMPSDEHRCVSSASAIILYSMLAEEEEEHGSETPSARAILAQAGDGFVSEFFDDAACRFRRTGSTDGGEGEGAPYWRAVDQAMGCLACLRLARLGHDAARTRAMATCAADSLLREFGYSLYATEGVPPGTYLGRGETPP